MKSLLLIILVSKSFFCFGQNWKEWTQQKKIQRKYLLEQIAALRVYSGYLKQGYDIAGTGWTTIRNIKRGDLNLHGGYLGSLKLVNPRIKSYGKVAGIILCQLQILKEIKKALPGIRESGLFTAEETNYCKMVQENLAEECLVSMDELFLVITAGELEMKDDERIKRIDALYTGMQEKYAFSSSFSKEMSLLYVQRMAEKMEINRFKMKNGLTIERKL